MSENRHFSRVSFVAQAVLVSQGQRHEAELLDISLKGALVRRPADWPAEAPPECLLELSLSGSDIVIQAHTEVAHQRGGKMGLQFVSIDVDSISHLRRLMELNLGDPGLIEREINLLQ